MHRRWKTYAAIFLTVFTLALPTHAASVEVNGTPLPATDGWIQGGTSYITLRAYSELSGSQLTWDGASAVLSGNGLSLTARPGQLYVQANDRYLYIDRGVSVVDGRTALPLRVLAEASGSDLSWDASRGVATLALSDDKAARANYNADDLYWLSRIISAESRGESLRGQIAVGNVILNRVASSRYPDTIYDVIFDRSYAVQFEPVENGTIYDTPTQSAVIAAKLCLEGANVVGNCLYFYAPALSSGSWIVNNCTYYSTIGCHKFYL
ncbi:MAG: cell wall hydrolase [Clostridium sp.]|nr:cell wall hydrolase [Clostridium sp.]